ncbi:hypothetical protein LCGC14_2360330 [marine sediment metagenome]|uniref:Uncharacterized protein n=1 Tax=marine sediment metagenome TaxID=412755 RepID=A0A0F9EJA8_9ZZZZ
MLTVQEAMERFCAKCPRCREHPGATARKGPYPVCIDTGPACDYMNTCELCTDALGRLYKERSKTMYHVIGLREDGRMVLFASYDDEPDAEVLEEAVEGYGYTQVLVIGSGGTQFARYEYSSAPRLKTVPLV